MIRCAARMSRWRSCVHVFTTPREPACVAEISRISVIARRDQLAPLALAMSSAFEMSLPAAGHFVTSGGLALLWTAPGRYLLQGRSANLLERAESSLGAVAGIFDVSDTLVSFRCSGPTVREGLRRLLPLDLDAPDFGPGCVAYTVAAHMPVQIRVLDDGPGYELLCRRSEAESFRHHLELSIV